MVIAISEHRIAYFPAPKNACTSLKLLFYELRNGKPFDPEQEQGGADHIHDIYGTPKFQSVDRATLADSRRIIVIRDPVERFLSSYANRVIFYEELSEEKINLELAYKLGLRLDPPLDLFIDRLDEYRLASPSVRHHTEPQSYFYGHDLSYFTHVYRIRDLRLLARDLGEMLGREITIPYEQSGGPKIPLGALSEKHLKRVIELFSGDYALLRPYFSPEAVLLKWKKDRLEGRTAPQAEPPAPPSQRADRELEPQS